MDENVSGDGEEERNEDVDGENNIAAEGNENSANNENDEEEEFDIALAASHSYMGTELLALSGRCVLEAGWTGRVPVIAHHGAVFPGETVPMLLTNSQDALVLARTLAHDKLFGLLCPDESGTLVSGYGVLCEVFEAADSDGVREILTFKARAVHRFRLSEMPKNSIPIHMYNRMSLVDVRVLPEVHLGEPLRHVRLPSLDRWRRERTQLDSRLRSMDATVTPWPLFVYDIFDFHRMKQTIKDYFSNIVKTPIPEEPVSLSFWTASNLTLSARDRLALFIVDDALLRLHMEVRLIARKSVLCCSSCSTEIARREHIFAMSSEGVHSNYTNLSGYMHDIVTVSRAQHTALSGPPSADFSWFPGYAWTVALCAACMAHVGWRFDAQKRSLRPQQFYGLCRNYVQPRHALRSPSAPASPPPAPPRAASPPGSLSPELRAARRALSALVYELRDDPPDE